MMTLKLKKAADSSLASSASLALDVSPSSRFLLAAPAALVRQRDEHLHVVEREEPRQAVDHSLVPVLVDLIGQGDDVALVEAQLSLVLRLKVVQGLAAGLLQGCGACKQREGWRG